MGGQCSGVLNADTPQGLLNCIYFAKVTYIQLHWPPLLQQKGFVTQSPQSHLPLSGQEEGDSLKTYKDACHFLC